MLRLPFFSAPRSPYTRVFTVESKIQVAHLMLTDQEYISRRQSGQVIYYGTQTVQWVIEDQAERSTAGQLAAIFDEDS